ncbi:hypothetical protein CHISP_2265 [Chitinispirillum alkaliphilum]|nr:hypothetical protein CHISP_2265 [Chitinispirillum alkaliphilum]
MSRHDIPGRLEKERVRKTSKKAKGIPFLGGRPKRDAVIGSDDITNLLIALYASRSFEEFLKTT